MHVDDLVASVAQQPLERRAAVSASPCMARCRRLEVVAANVRQRDHVLNDEVALSHCIRLCKNFDRIAHVVEATYVSNDIDGLQSINILNVHIDEVNMIEPKSHDDCFHLV